jgi:hypothetical protein
MLKEAKLFFEWLENSEKISFNNFQIKSEEEQNKLIYSYKKAFENCKCIRFVGSTNWYNNGCLIHT